MHSVKLKKGKENAVRQLHPWVFSGAIDQIKGNHDNGDMVFLIANIEWQCVFFNGTWKQRSMKAGGEERLKLQ